MILARPFPGIAFRVETPTSVALPRMDVCAFVGFAQRGPVNVPVVVESYPDFVDLFGGRYPLAWDSEANLWQTACLPAAVKAFFTQGGKRCWVVRVASSAATLTSFPLSGLLQTTLRGYASVSATARCVGNWADGIESRVTALVQALAFEPVLMTPNAAAPIQLQLPNRRILQAGDLLQLDFSDRTHRAYCEVSFSVISSSAVSTNGSSTDSSPLEPISLIQPHWFHRISVDQLPLSGTIHTTHAVPTSTTTGNLALSLPDSARVENNIVESATLSLTDTVSVEAGDWLRLETDESTLWLLVASKTLTNKLSIASVWAEGTDTTVGLISLARVQRVQMALQARATDLPIDALSTSQGTAFSLALSNLAGGAEHPRFIGSLPTDQDLFALKIGPQPESTDDAGLTVELRSPRFPLSLQLNSAIVIPLGLDVTLPWRAGEVPTGNSLVRDGLVPKTDDLEALTGAEWSDFFPEIFLDSGLRYVGVRSLRRESNDRLYRRGDLLTGLHALFPIEEVSVIACPDAAHPGWKLTTQVGVEPTASERPETLPDSCDKETPFEPCKTTDDGEDGSEPDESEGESTLTAPTLATQWQLLTPQISAYEATGLREVQQAAARFAAARADLVAVLSLPKHYRLPDVLAHQQQLLSAVKRDSETADSYLAMYYPWLVSREESGGLIHCHPAGAIAGVIAARSLNRGAWVAPANEPITDMVGTLPALSLTEEQTLYTSSINPILRRAQGFVAWGSYTLSSDLELEDLNVRRLLILLRRLALREGQRYVFAPHSAAFRRRVQQQFEQVLKRLFDLGAFAGRDPTEAYQVVIDGSLNTPAVVERGQLMVELRVAPSQPMTFITVRLLQTDNNQLSLQEVNNNGR